MLEQKPSATAMGAALYRAAHQLLDRPLVFVDPLALAIVGSDAERRLRSGEDRHAHATATALRALLAARSRFTEDCLAAAVARGTKQYVLLGAGLDTFAYRGGYDPAHLRVFEVDHPATQLWKRARLAEAAIPIPDSVVYAPVDFERETLAEGLARAGFDRHGPALFAWLGVVPYLTREAILATLRFVAQLPAGSEIVFDYPEPASAMSPAHREVAAAMAARVAAIGEPLRSAFVPAELAQTLRELGFSDVEDLDAAAMNARYFAGRTDGLAMRGYAHVLRARR
jgi:methyltransferase (TIGR00027 family)